MQGTFNAAVKIGLAAGLVAGLAVWTYLMMRIPIATPGLSAVIAAMPGGLLALVVGGLAFLLQRYPRSARAAAVFATAGCVGLTGILALGASHGNYPFDIGPYIVAWCLAWPIGFVASIWVDIQWAVAQKIVDRVRRTPSK
jgi:hypothetical protein